MAVTCSGAGLRACAARPAPAARRPCACASRLSATRMPASASAICACAPCRRAARCASAAATAASNCCCDTSSFASRPRSRSTSRAGFASRWPRPRAAAPARAQPGALAPPRPPLPPLRRPPAPDRPSPARCSTPLAAVGRRDRHVALRGDGRGFGVGQLGARLVDARPDSRADRSRPAPRRPRPTWLSFDRHRAGRCRRRAPRSASRARPPAHRRSIRGRGQPPPDADRDHETTTRPRSA